MLAARFCLLALTLTLSAQDIIFRAGTNEVVVPFAVFNERGQVQSCSAPSTLTVRENGVARPVLSVQQANNESAGFAIVFVHEQFAGFYNIDLAKLGAFVARELVREEDACVAINANGGIHLPKLRSSYLGHGRAGCMEMLDYIAQETELWRWKGGEIGYLPFSWAGTQRAAEELENDPHLRRAVLLLSHGTDFDHFGMPGGLIRKLAGRGIEVYALYYGIQDLNDPEIQARSEKLDIPLVPYASLPRYPQEMTKGIDDLKRLTEATGGRAYQVTRESAPGVARELVSNLRKGCVLTFSPGEEQPATAYRKIDVEVAQKGWKVRHRPGYYPNQASAPSGKPSTR